VYTLCTLLQLGYGTPDDVDSALNAGTVDVGAGLHAVSIHAGRDATCVILNNGKLLCWGSNESGK
jgi:Regulator of chromosome condensation (RCC1) repeat